jgi:hypothetical protein
VDGPSLLPPADEIPVTVALNTVLTVRPHVALHVPRLQVYRHGIDLVVVVQTDEPDRGIPWWDGAGGPLVTVDLGSGRVLIPGDGRNVSARHGDTVFRMRVVGTHAVCELSYWLTPLPSKFDISVRWPEERIAQVPVTLPLEAVHSAMSKARLAFADGPSKMS